MSRYSVRQRKLVTCHVSVCVSRADASSVSPAKALAVSGHHRAVVCTTGWPVSPVFSGVVRTSAQPAFPATIFVLCPDSLLSRQQSLFSVRTACFPDNSLCSLSGQPAFPTTVFVLCPRQQLASADPHCPGRHAPVTHYASLTHHASLTTTTPH